MKKLILVSLVAVFGCASVETKRPPTFTKPSQIVETIPLPPRPEDAPLNEYPGGEQDVEAISKGEASPMDGIVVSERRAARDSEFRSRYRELRTIVESDRAVWTEQRKLYETQLDQADRTIRESQPDFFEKYGFQIGVVSGGVLATVVTVAVVFAVSGASK